MNSGEFYGERGEGGSKKAEKIAYAPTHGRMDMRSYRVASSWLKTGNKRQKWNFPPSETHANGTGAPGSIGNDAGLEVYTVPNRLVEAVRAIYNYEARREDELSFKKGDIIHNVKTMPGMKSLANIWILALVVSKHFYDRSVMLFLIRWMVAGWLRRQEGILLPRDVRSASRDGKDNQRHRGHIGEYVHWIFWVGGKSHHYSQNARRTNGPACSVNKNCIYFYVLIYLGFESGGIGRDAQVVASVSEPKSRSSDCFRRHSEWNAGKWKREKC